MKKMGRLGATSLAPNDDKGKIRIMHPLRRRWYVLTLGLAILLAGLGACGPSFGQSALPERLIRDGKSVEAIRQLDQKWRAAGGLSPEEQRLYVRAYHLYGKQLLEKGDLNNARACFLRVINLDRGHADGYLQLGILEKQAKDYKKALSYLRTAMSLPGKHSLEAQAAMLDIATESLTAAEKAIGEGQVETARAYLTFVSSNYTGEEKRRADELMAYRFTPLAKAAAEYAKATQLLARRRKDEAVKILQSIRQTYPQNVFARQAYQLLQELGERMVVPRSPTGLQFSFAWKRKESAHFDVHYEKEIYFNRVIPRAEKVLPEIFASFGYSRPIWKRKCKVYLFNSRSDWDKFLQANREGTLEWSNAFTRYMEVYLYVERDTSYMVEHTLPHELAHAVHMSLVGTFAHTPLWFLEGLAVNHEEGKRKEAKRSVRSLRRTPLYIPFTEMLSMSSYPLEKEKVSVFYLEAAALVDILLQEFGPVKVRQMALTFRKPLPLETVLSSVLGITVKDLEKLWKKYVE